MRYSNLVESSPITLSGSFTDDLVVSKLWLCRELKNILDNENIKKLNAIYILGSWYGNMSIILTLKNIRFGKIINVDKNAKYIETNKKLAKKLDIDNNIEYMSKDANTLDYRQARKPSLVINTSCNDIKGSKWFDNIPSGTLVALQGRNNGDSVNQFESLDQFANSYDLSEIYYQKYIELEDPETEYQRYMVIGIK